MGPTKLDLTKEHKMYYAAKTTPELVEFDEVPFVPGEISLSVNFC